MIRAGNNNARCIRAEFILPHASSLEFRYETAQACVGGFLAVIHCVNPDADDNYSMGQSLEDDQSISRPLMGWGQISVSHYHCTSILDDSIVWQLAVDSL